MEFSPIEQSDTIFRIAADAILLGHVAFVAFVVVGLILVVIGGFRSWEWVRNPWFRTVHIAAIGLVVLQSWLGAICPLTTWEMTLRAKAGESTYSGAFVAHWLESILYYQAPAWVFVAAYTSFAVLVGAGWYWVRPRRFRS